MASSSSGQQSAQSQAMNCAYLVGHITVKDPDKWAEYRSRVPETLAPWGGDLSFRGRRVAAFGGDRGLHRHADIVVIRFPDVAAVDAWFNSPAYQVLIPLRQQAAEVDLLCYEV